MWLKTSMLFIWLKDLVLEKMNGRADILWDISLLIKILSRYSIYLACLFAGESVTERRKWSCCNQCHLCLLRAAVRTHWGCYHCVCTRSLFSSPRVTTLPIYLRTLCTLVSITSIFFANKPRDSRTPSLCPVSI